MRARVDGEIKEHLEQYSFRMWCASTILNLCFVFPLSLIGFCHIRISLPRSTFFWLLFFFVPFNNPKNSIATSFSTWSHQIFVKSLHYITGTKNVKQTSNSSIPPSTTYCKLPNGRDIQISKTCELMNKQGEYN